MDINKRLADTIRTRLASNGISLRGAADATEIPLVTLHRRLSGRSNFHTAEIVALAALLDTTASELVAAAEDAA